MLACGKAFGPDSANTCGGSTDAALGQVVVDMPVVVQRQGRVQLSPSTAEGASAPVHREDGHGLRVGSFASFLMHFLHSVQGDVECQGGGDAGSLTPRCSATPIRCMRWRLSTETFVIHLVRTTTIATATAPTPSLCVVIGRLDLFWTNAKVSFSLLNVFVHAGVSHGNHGRALVIGSRAVSALFTKFGLVMGLFSFLVVLASLLVGSEVPPSVLWCTRLEVPDPIFTVGLSPDKFDNGYEGLNTALPFPDVSSLRVSGMMVLYPCSVAQSVKSFVLLAEVMEAIWVFQSNNVSDVGHCPCQPPFSQKDLDLIDGVMLFGRDNSLSRSCSFLGPGFSDNFHTEHFLFAGQGKEKKPGGIAPFPRPQVML